jgi:hypothetical protein
MQYVFCTDRLKESKLYMMHPPRTPVFLLFLLIACICGFVCQAQPAGYKKNTFFGKYSLDGPVYAVNYDRIIARPANVAYTATLGFSVLNNKIAVPVGFNLFTGKSDHHPEFGITLTPEVEHKTYSSGETDNDKKIYVFPALGYRYQRNQGGLFMRAAAGPLITLDPASDDFWNMDPRYSFSFSVGIGYTFGK